jgi:hypothetical protein
MARNQFSHSTPAAPAGADNIYWQAETPPTDPSIYRSWSAYVKRSSVLNAGVLVGVLEIEITAGAAGNFTVAHGLGALPGLVLLQMTSGGEIWFQSARYDGTYLYLTASAAGLTCTASLWMSGATVEVPLAPGTPGNFTVAHGLAAVPALVLVQMTSGGEIWLQSPLSYDGTNIYLTASAGSIAGNAIVFGAMPNPVIVETVTLSLAPSSPGPFKVAHGLPGLPNLVLVQMTSGGEIWLQSPLSYDETYVYFEASAAGITATVQVWVSGGGVPSGAPTTEVAFTSSAGNFTVAHGLGYKPTSAAVMMTSLGSVVFQAATRWDATNFYLQGSAAGLTGFVEVWK